MVLKQSDLLKLCHLAISAAKKAGNIIQQYSNKNVTVQNKSTGTSKASQVVTEVDLLCQKAILKTLSPTLETYNLGLLTEESIDNNSRFEKDYFWCIDPLDGTLPFIEGIPGYSVSIALVSKEGIPYIGIIYNPLEDTLYHAIKGMGAYKNGKAWQLEKAKRDKPLTFICDRSFKRDDNYLLIVNQLEQIAKELAYKNLHIISNGGAAMNACWVLENNPACYFKFPKKDIGGGSVWDFAASACLFNEIGGYTGNFLGGSIALNEKESTFMNKQGVLFASNLKLAQEITKIYAMLSKS